MALPSITSKVSIHADPTVKLDADELERRIEQKKEQGLAVQGTALHPTAQMIHESREPAAIRINPRKIKWSPWANRLEENFQGQEFDEFVEDIRSNGGNKQAGKVRRLKNPEGEVEYELACGHRRHRACLIAGVPYLAIVKDMTDVELQKELETENRNRKDPSTYERALQYQKQLPCYDSVEHMSSEMGMTAQNMYKYLRVATLPLEILDLIDVKRTIGMDEAIAFLSFYEKSANKELYQSNLQRLLDKKITGKAKVIFSELRKAPEKASTSRSTELLDKHGSSYGSIAINRQKQLRIVIDDVTPDVLKKFEDFIKKTLRR